MLHIVKEEDASMVGNIIFIVIEGEEEAYNWSFKNILFYILIKYNLVFNHNHATSKETTGKYALSTMLFSF